MITKRPKRVPPKPLCRICNLDYEYLNREPCIAVDERTATTGKESLDPDLEAVAVPDIDGAELGSAAARGEPVLTLVPLSLPGPKKLVVRHCPVLKKA
jgi:hypothetical protein